LVGLSEGVSISHLIASRDRRIKALVLLSGIGSPGKDVLRYQVEQGVLSEQALSVLVKEDRNTRFLQEFDPLITARTITQPVLIVHGDRDRYVPYQDAFRLERAIRGNGNENVTTRVLAGYDHTLLEENPEGHIVSTRVPDEVLVLVRDWLAREL
jgi:dipeptidyl aminopeptidase/acylaminoacyl peptidase